jgi:SAM-dependent methyltransferase
MPVQERKPQFDVYSELPRSIDLGAAFPSLLRVSKRLQSCLRELSHHTTHEGIALLKDAFAANTCHSLDYEKSAYDFAYVYFLQNFWKGALLFHKSVTFARRILDIGAGSGATTFAYLTLLNDFLRDQDFRITPKFEVHVALVDKSRKQLKLASDLLNEISSEWRNLTVFPHFETTEFAHWNTNSHFDVALMGHVLNENTGRIRGFLEKAFELADCNSRIYLIERTDDPCWNEVNEGVSDLCLPRTEGRISDQIRFLKPFKAFPKGRHASTESRYMVLRCPEEKILARLLRKYFTAWRTQSVELLDEVFADNAEYYDKPFSRPLQGLKAIRKYWTDKVLIQQRIRISISRVGYSDLDAIAEWKSLFGLKGQQVEVRGCLLLRLDPSSQRIARLDEYYTSHKQTEQTNGSRHSTLGRTD